MDRLRRGLASTRALFESHAEDATAALTPERLEEALLAADVGVDLVEQISNDLAAARRRGAVQPGGELVWLRETIAEHLRGTVAPVQRGRPHVVLVVGVNGTGKTTTAAKLAAAALAEGERPLLVAADTFRAAAVEQLVTWADRLGVPVVSRPPGADPGAVVFDALQSRGIRDTDVVLVDTAGRLHTKHNLMNELEKLKKVCNRASPGSPHEVLLVLDATTGTNGLVQAREFSVHAGVTGVVLTKLDGTAKGGVVLAVARELGVPVRWLGVGEGAADLVVFDPDAFSSALLEGVV